MIPSIYIIVKIPVALLVSYWTEPKLTGGNRALYFFFLIPIYLRLFVFAVPPKKPIIHDANGRKMTSTLGPYKVGEKLIATCVTSAGKY